MFWIQEICPKCGHEKIYEFKDGRLRCAKCRKEWRGDQLPLRLSLEEWKKILSRFLNDEIGVEIANNTSLERKRVQRALKKTRGVMKEDVPEGCIGRINFIKGYIENCNRLPQSMVKLDGNTSPYNPDIKRILVILCPKGGMWATPISHVAGYAILNVYGTGKDLGRGSKSRGNVAGIFLPVPLNYGEVPIGPDNVVGLFWKYMTERLSGRPGIRRDFLPLYVAEYVWKFNRRKKPDEWKLERLLTLLHQSVIKR